MFDLNKSDNENENTLFTIQKKIKSRKEYNFHVQNSYSYNNKTIFETIPNNIEDKEYISKESSINKVKELSIHNSSSQRYIPPIIQNKNYPVTNRNEFDSKVIIQNMSSSQDIIYLLDDFLAQKNYKINYETSYEPNKLIFSFQEEKIAFEFIKLLNNNKNKYPAYKNIIVHLSLSPNELFTKKITEEKTKKRGISHESILKLFNRIVIFKKINLYPKY